MGAPSRASGPEVAVARSSRVSSLSPPLPPHLHLQLLSTQAQQLRQPGPLNPLVIPRRDPNIVLDNPRVQHLLPVPDELVSALLSSSGSQQLVLCGKGVRNDLVGGEQLESLSQVGDGGLGLLGVQAVEEVLEQVGKPLTHAI